MDKESMIKYCLAKMPVFSFYDPLKNAYAKSLDEYGWKPGQDTLAAWYWIAKKNFEECVKIGGPAVDPLIANLESFDEDICAGAAWALGEIGDPRAVDSLIKTSRSGAISSNATDAAQKALEKIGATRPIDVNHNDDGISTAKTGTDDRGRRKGMRRRGNEIATAKTGKENHGRGRGVIRHGDEKSIALTSMDDPLDKLRRLINLLKKPAPRYPEDFIKDNYLMLRLLEGANLRGADLAGIDLGHPDWTHPDNIELFVCLGGADLREANLTSANLSFVDFTGANLNGANLSNANLKRAQFDHANLSEVNLSGANLEIAWLQYTNLRKANLSGANLDCAHLDSAKLDGVILRGAILTQVNLSDTDLRNTDLRDVNMERVYYNDSTQWPDGFDPVASGAILIYHDDSDDWFQDAGY
jgi:uncharacterized protein YjbI with pentapeptide repeats